MSAIGWLQDLGRAGLRRASIARETAVDAAAFMSGNVLYQGARFAAYLVVARLLGPTLYGLWNGLLLILSNGVSYGHLGVLNAMNREIPYNHGRGEEAENRAIIDVSFTTALISSGLLAAACLAASLAGSWDPAEAAGLRLLALLILLQQVQVFYELVLRSHTRFRAIALEQGLLSFLLLTVVIGLTILGGFRGFLWGQIATYGIVALVLMRLAPVRPRLRWDWRRMVDLAQIGFPIMAVGFAYGMLTSLDRFMVIGFLGKEALGFYSLAFMAYGTMMLIPRSVSQMIYPRMAREYGRTGTAASLRRLVYRPVGLLFAVMTPLLLLAWLAGPPLIAWFLPQYTPGIPAFRLTLVAVFFLSFMGTFGNFLNTVNRQRLYLGLQVCALALDFVLNWLALRAGYGITGVAGATLITQMVYVAMLWSATHRILRRAPAPVAPAAGAVSS